jgi:muramoyltetrapeptide carboxypeptidase LdcA involved in peptidoglycan recycling
MTPEQLRQIALDSSKNEYEAIVAQMHAAAKQGSLSCNFPHITEGAIEQLKEEGFQVISRVHITRSMLANKSTPYFEVRFDDED